tara:strand:- start:168 stop:887 length:720 start_codon:yes stop_codon:yes gene_type:complete
MNIYENISNDDTDDTDILIDNDKQLRNRKKKLRTLKNKPKTPDNLYKIKRLRVAIDEYEHQLQSRFTGKKKVDKTSKKSTKDKRKKLQDDDEYLNQAYMYTQTPAYKEELNALRKKEEQEKLNKQKLKEQREKQRQKEEQEKQKQKQKEEQEKQKRKEQQKQKEEQESKLSELYKYLKTHNASSEIMYLANNYTRKGYLALARKFHTDKGGSEEEFKLIGYIKDFYIPNTVENDETWTK